MKTNNIVEVRIADKITVASISYQYMHREFFATCRKYKINKVPLLLLAYLRDLYLEFGKTFARKDEIIMNDLGINQKMLQRSRLTLQRKNTIDFVSGKGQEATQYFIKDSMLITK